MKAIRLNQPGQWETIDTSAPDENLAPGESIVKILKMGVCGTDLHAFNGTQPFFNYPRILGHELAVEVVAVHADVDRVKIGDRCAVEPYYNTSISQAVKMGKPNCGDTLRVLGVHVDGGMQEFLKIDANLLHPNKLLSEDQLALVEPLAIGCHAVDRAQITAKDTVLVIGAGPIGLGAMQFAQLSGARVMAMDIDSNKLTKAGKITSIMDTFLASANSIEALKERLDGDLPTVILDATGNATSMLNTFNLVAAGGTIVFIGLFQGDVVFNDPNFHQKELTLKASRAALTKDFHRVMQLIEVGQLEPKDYITHRMGFDEVPDQFVQLYEQKGELVKAIIDY